MSQQNLQAEFAEAMLTDNHKLDCVNYPTRSSIHRQHYFSTLIKALKEAYPLVNKLVGDDFFSMTAKEYIFQYPSRSSNLIHYGEYFSDFLIEYPPVKNLVYLPDVAAFEWSCHIVYYAPDHDGFEISLVEDLSPEQYDILHLTMHPASRLMQSHYPLLKIIDLCHGEHPDDIDLEHGCTHLLIIRRELDISLLSLSEGEFTFLSTIYEGYSLLDALNETLAVDPLFELETKLPEWIQQKIIVDCR